MGQLVASGPTEYVARMGGVPNSTWTGLATVPTKHRPGRLRPNRVEYEAKAYETRKAGLSTKFSKGKSLTRFAKDVFKHLSDYGLDTISYAPNPEQRTVMSSVVEDHPKFTLDYIKSISSTQASRYDEYDQTNDAAAKDMLMASLDETLSDLVYNYVEIQSEPFIVVWMTFVDQLMEHSFDHFESLKESIKTTTFKQYPGENLASYCHAQREFCKELDCAGAYDFNLNRTLVANIAHAGGGREPMAPTFAILCPLSTGVSDKASPLSASSPRLQPFPNSRPTRLTMNPFLQRLTVNIAIKSPKRLGIQPRTFQIPRRLRPSLGPISAPLLPVLRPRIQWCLLNNVAPFRQWPWHSCSKT